MQRIYSSNRLETLCHTLAHQLKEPRADIFSKDVIITQTAGMNAWLKTELASRNGILANCTFQNQDGFMAEIYQLMFGEQLASQSDAMKYRLFTLLDHSGFLETFPDVAGYYDGNELRRFQLAGKIADLFDQYQLYRPEMVEQWEKGIFSTQNPAESWQQWLWKGLGIESRGITKAKIITALGEKKDLIKKTYPVISLFGITVYTKYHLDFFRKLGEITTVDFYVCLPTNQLPFHNELLESYGSKAAELAGIFNIAGFNAEQNENGTLLSYIQNQILNNTDELEWMEDGSLQVNSCYTPVREVECLYNYLLDLFESDRHLRPRDILVMTTEINKYAPYVKAVFRNAPVNIPFQVSGAANNSDDTMVAALEQILSFTEEDLTSEKVVSLLEQKRISKRYGIKDCHYIRSVVKKANIRFGRENRVDDDTRYVSWRYGLEKILLGYAMLSDEEYPIGENLTVYPFKDSEASVSYDLFRLKAFFETLESVIDEQKEYKTLADWKLYLVEEVIEKMIYHNDFEKDDRLELSTIYRALSFIDNLELSENVPFPVFLDELKSKLFVESGESKLNTGRITVSSPIPVRGLPYKVICFLGLNNDVFPRKDRFMGFDLLGEEYLEGDRNIKETDKYLFLDTILAARERLYLSYIGQSVKDNTEIPPSIVVDTLLDYVGRKDFVVKHPLHGFSSFYKQDDPRMFTYLYNQNTDEYSIRDKEEKTVSDVSISSLVKFFQAPVDWYFNTILDIRFEDNDTKLSETELFDLDNLQMWIIKNEMLRIEDNDFESYLDKGKMEGYLPLKSAADVTIERLKEEVKYILPAYKDLVGNRKEDKIVIDTVIDNVRIAGTIEGVYDKDFIAYSLSSNLLKHKIEAYIKSLLLSVTGNIESAKFLDGNGVVSNVLLSSNSAQEELEALLQYFREGNNAPLLFSLKAAEAFASKPVKNKTKLDQIRSAFNEEAYPKEKSPFPANLYLQILIRENNFENFGEEDIRKIGELAEKLNLNFN